MYTFARFPDLGAFSHIVQSHPKFENTPSGLIRDKDGMVLGHALAPLGTRRFGSFRGAEGETFATPPPSQPAILPPVSKDIGLAMDLSRIGVMPPLSQIIGEEEKSSLGPTMTEINKIFDSMVSSKKSTPAKQARVPKSMISKKALKKAVRAGIKASQEGDVETAKRVTKREALSAGIPDVLATILEKEAGKAIKKHALMESREVDGIVEKAERKRPMKRNEDIKHGGGRRGRPAGSRGAVVPPEMKGMTAPEMRFGLKKIGYKATSKMRKPDLIRELSNVSAKSGTPVNDILNAPQGGELSSRLMEVARDMGKTMRKFDIKKRKELPRVPGSKRPSTPRRPPTPRRTY